jgi:hypothetical protein
METMMSHIIKAVLATAALLAVSSGAQAKRYCCSNPAICRAVCGSACCGDNFAIKAQQQEKQSKPKLAAPTTQQPR